MLQMVKEKIMYLDIKTEYSFGKVFGHIDKVAEKASKHAKWAGMADINGTWGHVKWKKACEKVNIKPIYGIRLTVIKSEDIKNRKCERSEIILIALNNYGLTEIYEHVNIAHQQFYYWPRITYEQLNLLTKNTLLIAGPGIEIDKLERHAYKRISPNDPTAWQLSCSLDPIACIDNYYVNSNEKLIYEPFADERKLERKTGVQYIPDYDEWLSIFPQWKTALDNLNKVSEYCNVDLPKAEMLRYTEKLDIEKICIEEAPKKGIDLSNPIYKERLKKEIDMIKSRDFDNYFLIVSDLVKYAKSKMCVGPSRGSSAGSLVCYLMSITEIDPVPYGLYFERFIDVNRLDLPDIDIDFQDNKRELAIEYLRNKYGYNNVAQIGNVNRLKPKSALTRFAKSLNVPLNIVDKLKDAIPVRAGGDSRASMCITDTFSETETGKNFIEKYPNMKNVEFVEGHASHTGIHAAGVIVCNDNLTKFCGINSRDKKAQVAMIDKKDVEPLNLLKIDILGLRTLTVLADTCDSIGKPYSWLYKIPLNDEQAYKVFNDGRFSSIFQFEGEATANLTRQMKVENIEDIAALNALSRPGPLMTGSSDLYVARKMGTKPVEYVIDSDLFKKTTEATYGVIVYQEQVLKLCREYGKLSWKDTSVLRNAMSHSYGSEFFDQYKKRFVEGAVDQGELKEDAEKVWQFISTYGSYGFNKSHALAYAWISYLCAYLKAHYPLEFEMSCLNNIKEDRMALKLLRDFYETEGIKYVPFDIEKSQINWSVQDGKLYGGLTTLHGIGPSHSKKIIELRKANKPFPPGIQKRINEMDTPFLHLYPAKEKYGDYYKNPKMYNIKGKINYIKDIKNNGKYVIIGCLIRKNLTDINDTHYLAKRDGKYLSGPSLFLHIVLEDDTDNILCTIHRYQFEELGREVAETAKENKDWFLAYGQIKGGYRRLSLINIRKITKEGK